MNLTNLVLLSIQVVANDPGITITSYVNYMGQTRYITVVDAASFTTNYHFGIIQGTNQIQLLTLQQK